MDIEGGEYQCLPQIKPYTDKINGMAVEFHDLDANIEKFEEILDLLKQDFYIAHIHNSNFSDLTPGINITSVVEITFMNKILASGDVKLSKAVYPVKGLDFPCDWRSKDNYKLIFED
jgi:hypothetical protein